MEVAMSTRQPVMDGIRRNTRDKLKRGGITRKKVIRTFLLFIVAFFKGGRDFFLSDLRPRIQI